MIHREQFQIKNRFKLIKKFNPYYFIDKCQIMNHLNLSINKVLYAFLTIVKNNENFEKCL